MNTETPTPSPTPPNFTYEEHNAIRTLRSAMVKKGPAILDALFKDRSRDSQIQMALLLKKEIENLLDYTRAAMAFTRALTEKKGETDDT